MFVIYGGKQEFAQWDLDQLVTNSCMKDGDAVVFKAKGKTIETTAYSKNGEVVADVPNHMLQEHGIITVDLGWGLDVRLECRTEFNVADREKPEDYCCDFNIKSRPESGGVSSWNDLTDKPFYEESGMVEVLAETTLEVDEITPLSHRIGFIEGDTYKVVYNGVEYTCVAKAVSFMDISVVAIGDASMIGGTGNGEPFLAFDYDAAGADAMGMEAAFNALDGSTSVTISIYHDATVIKPIEGKYLPKGTPWIEEGGMVPICKETVAEFDEEGQAELQLDLPIAAGKTYAINWNGTEYYCTALDVSSLMEGLTAVAVGNGVPFGLPGNNEPFVIVSIPAHGGVMLIDLTGASEATFSVYSDSVTIQKLDNRCLDLAWLPVYNKEAHEFIPEYTSETTANVDIFKNTTGLVHNNTYIITFDGVEYEIVAKNLYEGLTDQIVYIAAGNLALNNGEDNGMPFLMYEQYGVNVASGGVWIVYQNWDVPHTVSVKEIGDVPNKMPDKFMPEGTFKNEDSYFILTSKPSADGYSKKFKITVNYNGTLEAEEV